MATKKQRRRREKLHRHEYEYVELGEDGREIPVTPPKARREPAAGPRAGGQLVDARGRVVKPPSWERALKRGAIFGPILFAFIFFLGGNSASTAAKLVNALVLVAIFIPFSYFMDRVIYRQVLKRQARSSGTRR
jgi:hypothetical protein